jgi:beta-lactamase class A
LYPASIYKLYLADVVYDKITKGNMSLSDKAMTGKTVKQCIDLMIVQSDNPCAHALGDIVSWSNNNQFLASQGFGSTTLKKSGSMTTANDTANFLIKLQTGSLISPVHTSSLLSMMKRQIYRSGIPAGSSGPVANKVGFINELNHDAGIVYHPRGNYVLVIMTKNSSYANIADLSKHIYNLMSH